MRSPFHPRTRCRNDHTATPAVDATFATIRAAGAEVAQEPTDQPYGVRDCAFRDPAGNLIRINEVH